MMSINPCKMNTRQMFLCIACSCGFAGIFYYSLFRNFFVDINGTPSVAVNGVVALTGFLSISQHQLNSKTGYNGNLHIIKANLSSRNSPRVISTRAEANNIGNHSSEDSWEDLELYTVSKPSPGKMQRKFGMADKRLDEKFLRSDERSIERILDGLATDSDDKVPEIFKKRGRPTKRFPNVIIIGVKKGGTRALLEMIKLHPQICSCGPEIHYFDRHYAKGIEWYRNRMPLCYENEITIEKTPSYFVTSGVAKSVFEYSKRLNKTLKLLVIVRDPTKRAISDYTQVLSHARNAFKPSFKESALRQEIDGRPYVNSRWGAIKIGVYAKHLKRWYRYFQPSQIHIVSGEALIKKPFDEIKKVEEFLNLPPFIRPEHFVYNETKGFYCTDRGIGQLNTSMNSTNLRCLGSSKGRLHIAVSNETERVLREYYKPFNEELYRLIGRNFGWP
ncbi:heparan sulfate glucosamine 3-O-sulfotransferase 5-like [Dendronephthya gigantea]|uniref:heparan sulfate glucosamine 3-O-sulfotransferase 5-like n=1 Tax=Dendronephthya gigantea TaxID=151771 RepID=UPI00106A5466|nr:heparan sulfate glucosamine 3-O-sulfotransferase 5-like [Dendronephthya gigantea]